MFKSAIVPSIATQGIFQGERGYLEITLRESGVFFRERSERLYLMSKRIIDINFVFN